MSDLADLRSRLRDRQVKEGALGTAETLICLDLSLIADLEDLNKELADAPQPEPEGKPRLGAATAGDSAATKKLKAAIEAKEDEIRAASVTVRFRALGSTQYQQVLAEHPNANDDGFSDFLNDLCAKCLFEVVDSDGTKHTGITWEEIQEGASYGEWDEATTKVLALNRRRVDVPFSLKPSKKSRS